MLADQRHEPHAAQILELKCAVFPLRALDQNLDGTWIADRHDDPAAGLQLVDEYLRDVASAGCRDDSIERRFVRASAGPVAVDNRDIVIPKTLQPVPA